MHNGVTRTAIWCIIVVVNNNNAFVLYIFIFILFIFLIKMCLPKTCVHKYHIDTLKAHIYTSFLALSHFKTIVCSSDCLYGLLKCSSVCKVFLRQGQFLYVLHFKWEQNIEVLVNWTVICSQSITHTSTLTHMQFHAVIRW